MNSYIYILDDCIITLQAMQEIISSFCPNMIVKAFQTEEDLLKDPEINKADLFIIDIVLNDRSGLIVAKELADKYPGIPFLFISGYLINQDIYNFLTDNIGDFISKPFETHVLINRISILLRISRKLQSINVNLWNIFNYSTFFAIILNRELTIRLCNHALASALGFENENELIGKSWLQFVPNSMNDIIKHVSGQVIDNNPNYREFTNEIITLKNEIIHVKWFNSYINQATDSIFSVGVPLLNISPEDTIDSIRAYFRDIINKDKQILQSMKELTLREMR